MDSEGVTYLFQHTAARRRLLRQLWQVLRENMVSTHSRPKAADRPPLDEFGRRIVSTHSRPKAAVKGGYCVS